MKKGSTLERKASTESMSWLGCRPRTIIHSGGSFATLSSLLRCEEVGEPMPERLSCCYPLWTRRMASPKRTGVEGMHLGCCSGSAPRRAAEPPPPVASPPASPAAGQLLPNPTTALASPQAYRESDSRALQRNRRRSKPPSPYTSALWQSQYWSQQQDRGRTRSVPHARHGLGEHGVAYLCRKLASAGVCVLHSREPALP